MNSSYVRTKVRSTKPGDFPMVRKPENEDFRFHPTSWKVDPSLDERAPIIESLCSCD